MLYFALIFDRQTLFVGNTIEKTDKINIQFIIILHFNHLLLYLKKKEYFKIDKLKLIKNSNFFNTSTNKKYMVTIFYIKCNHLPFLMDQNIVSLQVSK